MSGQDQMERADLDLLSSSIQSKGEDLSKHLGNFRTSIGQAFPTPQHWPGILDAFGTLTKSQYAALNEQLNENLDGWLLKPMALENIHPQAFEDLFRWKLEDSLDLATQEAVTQDIKARGWEQNYEANLQEIEAEVFHHNELIDELVKLAKEAMPNPKQQVPPKLIPEQDKALLSQLLIYDSAVRGGGMIMETKHLDEKLQQPKKTAQTRPKLTRSKTEADKGAESQQRLFREATLALREQQKKDMR